MASEAQLSLSEDNFLYFYEVLVDNLKHPNADIQKDALDAFKVMFSMYSELVRKDKISSEIGSKMKDFIKMAVYDENVYITKGFSSALPFFDITFIEAYFQEIIEALLINSKIKKMKNEDSDTRKFSIESLYHISARFLNSKVFKL